MALDMNKLSAFVERSKEIKELKTRMKKLQEENDDVEEQLIDGMIDSGIKNMRIGDRLVGMRTQLWASAPDVVDEYTGEVVKDWPTAIDALKAAGHGDLAKTTVHSGTLSSLIRELRDSDDGIPEILENNLKITEDPKFYVRK